MTGFVKKTKKYCIITTKEGYRALLVVFSLTDRGYSLGNLQTVFSNVYYFLSSTTDRSKEINRHMNSANFPPIDIQENLLKLNVLFDHPKLDIYCPEKKKMTETIVKVLKK